MQMTGEWIFPTFTISGPWIIGPTEEPVFKLPWLDGFSCAGPLLKVPSNPQLLMLTLLLECGCPWLGYDKSGEMLLPSWDLYPALAPNHSWKWRQFSGGEVPSGGACVASSVQQSYRDWVLPTTTANALKPGPSQLNTERALRDPEPPDPGKTRCVSWSQELWDSKCMLS